MSQEDAITAIIFFEDDMIACKGCGGRGDYYDLMIVAANYLITLIDQCPSMDPIDVAKDFKERLDEYSGKHPESEAVFQVYANAIRNIIVGHFGVWEDLV